MIRSRYRFATPLNWRQAVIFLALSLIGGQAVADGRALTESQDGNDPLIAMQIAERRQLTGAEIRNLFTGNTLYHRRPITVPGRRGGVVSITIERWSQLRPDGSLALKCVVNTPGGSKPCRNQTDADFRGRLVGVWSIRGNQLCVKAVVLVKKLDCVVYFVEGNRYYRGVAPGGRRDLRHEGWFRVKPGLTFD